MSQNAPENLLAVPLAEQAAALRPSMPLRTCRLCGALLPHQSRGMPRRRCGVCREVETFLAATDGRFVRGRDADDATL